MKRLRAARNASVVGLVTTSIWIAFVAKQTNIAMYPFVVDLLMVVLNRSKSGPAWSNPVVRNALLG
jgi:hypothetical protein